MFAFSDITRDRFRRFRKIKRAWWSLWILTTLFILSLFSEHLANDRPLLMRYDGRFYFPTSKFYPAAQLGGQYNTEANYLALKEQPEFSRDGNYMVFPPIAYHPSRPYLDSPGRPPHPPSRRHWLGTDNAARDITARLLYGFRISMLFALALTAISAIAGVLIGSVQAYLGGKTDLVTQRFVEVWDALPFLYVVILMGSIYGQSFGMLLLVMSLFSWIGLSYYMRGEVYKLKEQTYVLAARSLGVGRWRILFRQILPNAMTPLITLLPFSLVGGISSLTALDFLGFGLPPPTPSWGEMLEQGLSNLQSPWVAMSALLALFITLLLAAFIGEGARAAFDPKSYSRLR